MSMNEFRRLAAKIDQHMQRLAAEGVNDAPAIINRMMGYVPDLHKIWVGTSDDQLMALSDEFSGFYRYAIVMEEASEAEVREILAIAVKPESRVRLGEALSALGRKVGLTNEDFEVFQQARDTMPAEPMRFE